MVESTHGQQIHHIWDYDTGDTELCNLADFPESVRAHVHVLLDFCLECPECNGKGCEVQDEDSECKDGKVTGMKITFRKGDGVYYTGIHVEGCPSNPSGCDYYFGDDTYIGWSES